MGFNRHLDDVTLSLLSILGFSTKEIGYNFDFFMRDSFTTVVEYWKMKHAFIWISFLC